MTNLEKLSDEEFLEEFRRGAEKHEDDAINGDPFGASFEYLCDLVKEVLIRELDMPSLGRVEH